MNFSSTILKPIKTARQQVSKNLFKDTVQWELRGVKIGINRSLMMYSLAGKCHLPCPKGHHHERSINVFSGCGCVVVSQNVFFLATW